jgi:hypothetical protein
MLITGVAEGVTGITSTAAGMDIAVLEAYTFDMARLDIKKKNIKNNKNFTRNSG